MDLKQQNILFISRSTQHGGTENVILQLCDIFKPLVNSVIVCCASGIRKDYFEKKGIKYYEIPDIEDKNPLTIIQISNVLKKIVKNERITIIHTHHRMAAFYVSLLGLYKKCKFLNTSHNTFENKKALTRFSYKHAKLIACGEMVQKNLIVFFELPNVTVIHNAVKPFNVQQVADPLIEKLHAGGCYIVGNVGRLSEQKGMEYYVQAMPDILENHPEARFLIIGSGEDQKKLNDMVNQLNIEDKVFFMGYRTDIQNLISQIDLMVLSSLWEGFPLTPIEAFSVGKTIVATAVDGTVEIVKDRKNGLLIKPRNYKQISDKVCWMIEHPEEKKKMEKNALESYRVEFSMDKFTEGYIKCYESE